MLPNPIFKRKEYAQGFTLVELLVVFAIMGLLVGIVPGSFDRLQETVRYRDTLRFVIGSLREARFRANSEEREVLFGVDLRNRQFVVEGKELRNIPLGLEVKVTVAQKEIDPQGTASIRFLPQGGATGGNIEILRPNGGGSRVKVDWLSGKVSQEPLQH